MNVDEYPSDAVYMHFIIQIDVGINMELCMFNCFDVLKTTATLYIHIAHTIKAKAKYVFGTASPFILTQTRLYKYMKLVKKIFFFLLFLLLLYCNYPKLSILTSLSFAGDGADEDDDGFT